MTPIAGYKMMEEVGEEQFKEKLYSFMAARGTPIVKVPVLDKRDLDLFRLYKEVTSRGGLETVIMNKMWRSVTNELSVDPDRTDAGYRLRSHYVKYLYPFERKFFLGLSDQDFDFAAFERMLSKGSKDTSNISAPIHTSNWEKEISTTDDMHSESYGESNGQDQMAHYAYPTEQTFEYNNNLSSPTSHNNNINGNSPTNNTQTNKNGKTTGTRISTRLRTGAKVYNAGSNALGSPEGKEIEKEKETPTTTKGRGKRARVEKKEKEVEKEKEKEKEELTPEGEQVSLASNFSKLDLGALKKYKQYHQMRLDTSANKSEIIEAVSLHFSQQQVDEIAIIRKFVAHVKNESENRKEKEARRRNSKIVRA